MYTQAATFVILGQSVYIYGLFLSVACLLAGSLLLLKTRKTTPRQKNAAALTCLLSPMLGLFFARLVYVAAEVNFAPFLSFQNAVNLRLGGLSMYGALIGAVLGAVISARLGGLKKAEWLDMITPSLFLFIAVARLGEQYTTLGISRPLVTGVLDHTFLAVRDEFDAYLRTYLLENAAAIILCAACFVYNKKQRRAGDVFLFGALLFGASQTLFDSLRFDANIRFSFIGLHQVLSAALFSGVMIFLAVRLIKQKSHQRLAVLSMSLILPLLGAIIGIEFMIDRSQVNKWLSYAIYVTVLIIPCYLGLTMLKRERV